MSETHYSLKEMETNWSSSVEKLFLSTGRKPTTLWKRWKHRRKAPQRPQWDSIVGNPLLSERDGNPQEHYLPLLGYHFRRKPTTLWKRWKPLLLLFVPLKHCKTVGNPLLSERDGNLKCKVSRPFWKLHVGNPLLSERDGNSSNRRFDVSSSKNLSETHYSLKEMETTVKALLTNTLNLFCRKPTTLWKRWKPISLLQNLHLQLRTVGNPLLSERDGNELLTRTTTPDGGITSETHYSLKEMETWYLR